MLLVYIRECVVLILGASFCVQSTAKAGNRTPDTQVTNIKLMNSGRTFGPIRNAHDFEVLKVNRLWEIVAQISKGKTFDFEEQ